MARPNTTPKRRDKEEIERKKELFMKWLNLLRLLKDIIGRLNDDYNEIEKK